MAASVVDRFVEKPDPEIYNLAARQLRLDPARCVVVEDSRNGFLAAMAARMHCVVTTNGYTEHEDFSGADLVVSELGEAPKAQVSLETVKRIVANE